MSSSTPFIFLLLKNKTDTENYTRQILSLETDSAGDRSRNRCAAMLTACYVPIPDPLLCTQHAVSELHMLLLASLCISSAFHQGIAMFGLQLLGS